MDMHTHVHDQAESDPREVEDVLRRLNHIISMSQCAEKQCLELYYHLCLHATSPSRSSLSQTIIAGALDDLVDLFQQDGIRDVSFPRRVSRAKQSLRDGHVKDASKSL
jgi:hypothetical protein